MIVSVAYSKSIVRGFSKVTISFVQDEVNIRVSFILIIELYIGMLYERGINASESLHSSH